MRTRPVILHLDLDAFFSAVEQLHKPSLRGKPVVVGGTGRRGVVSTASYEARAFGVGSAMPIGEARRRCPNAAYLAPRFAAYRASSQVVMGMLAELSPLVEQVSVDEAYVDLTPVHPQIAVAEVTRLADAFRIRVHEVTGLTASIGVSTSKLVSKIGSELNKPNGLTVIAPGREQETLAPMPIRRLPGVGPATQERLHRHGLHTVGEVAQVSAADLIDILGQAHGSAVHLHARGIDHRELEPDRDAKSISAEETFPFDLTDQRELAEHLRRMTERVISRLINDGGSARTITLKIRSYDFSTITRSLTLDQPTDSGTKILAGARQLLAAVDTSDGIRLLGVGVSGLSDFAQQDLFADLADLEELAVETAEAEGTSEQADRAQQFDGTDRQAGPQLLDARGSESGSQLVGGAGPEGDAELKRGPESLGAAPRGGVDQLGVTVPGNAGGADTVGGAETAEESVGAGGTDRPTGEISWRPGQDVLHAERGPGWVQGAGLGRVTVRFEGPHTGKGPIVTFLIDDPALSPAEPPVW
jgi:DNA polymerase-4